MRLCKKCDKPKPLEEFDKNKECSEGRTRTCSACNRERQQKWYHNCDKEKRLLAGKAWRRATKEMFVKEKGGCCSECKGVFPSSVYDFHHIDTSEKEFSIGRVKSVSRMREELKKCILLCANCHRIEHFEE